MIPAKKQQRDPLNRRLGGPQSQSERLNKLWGCCAYTQREIYFYI